MSGIATLVHWSAQGVDIQFIERMLDAMPHRATDGRATLRVARCGMGFARHATTAREVKAVQPLQDSLSGLCVTADARLDNRDELIEMLGEERGPARTDPEILLRGYERWGTGLAERLVGDFAFVIWDAARRELYAARDPLGIRPLYYHAGPAQIALASEVGPICSLPGIRWDLDDTTLLDYLLGCYRHTRRTFFSEVSRIAPGHYLLAKEGSLTETAYWRPPRQEVRLSHAEEYRREFRRLFDLSVTARLDADRPIVADLSGGLDSSAIVCTADAIYRRDAAGRPPMLVVSAIYSGLACDETPAVDAVARRLTFRSERYDGTVWNPVDDGLLWFDHPGIEALAGVPEDGWHRLAQPTGARVRLRGVGAEEILLENGVFRDLAAHGRWWSLYRQCTIRARGDTRPAGYWFKQAITAVAPPLARRLYRWLRPRRPQPPGLPPPWLGPQLRSIWSGAPEEAHTTETWTSHAQRYNWLDTIDPHTCWMLDLLGYWDAKRGFECRFPFLDVRLARFMLAVPYEHRLLVRGRKEMLRKAMADRLPERILGCARGPSFDVTKPRHIAPNLPRYSALLSDETWLSEPYVNRREAQRLLQRVTTDPGAREEPEEWGILWKILMLERWLRALEAAGHGVLPRRADPPVLQSAG